MNPLGGQFDHTIDIKKFENELINNYLPNFQKNSENYHDY
jgi:hypothetical protein